MENEFPIPPPQRTPLQRLVVGFLQWPLAVGLFHRTVKTLFGLRVRGLEHLPAQRPLLLVSNHGSHFDGLFLRVLGRQIIGAPVVSIAWGGVRHFPFARAALEGRAFHIVLTDETSPTARMRAGVLEQIIEHLRAGRSVAMNPEGDRYNRLTIFQPGAAYAAIETGVPMVPITLQGVYPLWRTLPWPRRWWGQVTAQFHPAVFPADYSGQPRQRAVQAMTAEVRTRIASMLDYPDDLNPADPRAGESER